ncbi:MAG TPA: hypothetical protein VF897_18650 [Roseiflexaceae bacterium]
MRRLSARDIVQIWDWGQDRHPVDRALLLLAVAHPDLAPEQVAALTVGQRNSRLLALREKTMGPALHGFASCSECGTALEFEVDARAIRAPEPAEREYALLGPCYQLRLRLPDSRDLAAIAGLGDVEAARCLLIERCVLQAEYQGQAIAPSALPDSLIPALADAVTEHDPQAEMRFKLTCAQCGHSWSALFDIVSFFWTEIDGLARRLLDEVHTLARAYGWREAEILSMSASHRQVYLEMAG